LVGTVVSSKPRKHRIARNQNPSKFQKTKWVEKVRKKEERVKKEG
jgi:ribosomal protein L24E